MSRRPAIAEFAKSARRYPTRDASRCVEKDRKIVAMLNSGRFKVTRDGRVFDNNYRLKGGSVERGTYRAGRDKTVCIVLWDTVQVRLSRLVCLAYHGLPPAYAHVHHVNGDHDDVRAENLEWVVPKETSRRAHQKGLIPHPVGLELPNTKLSPSIVRKVRRMLSDGVSMREAARRIGVTKGAIDGIKYGKTWRHV